MRREILVGALPIYAKLLTEKLGLQLEIGGSQAYSTGGTIRIPALPCDNEVAQTYAYGYIMHESGHEDDTNHGIWPQEMMLAKLTNIFEDVRIEKRRMQRYPGAAKRLSDLVSQVMQDNLFPEPSANQPSGWLVQALLQYRLRAEVLGQEQLNAHANQAEKLVREVLPAGAFSRLNAMMYRVEKCQSTQDCIDLSTSIMDMLKEEQEKEEAKNSSHANDPESDQSEPQQEPDQDQGNDDAGANQSSADCGDGSEDDPSDPKGDDGNDDGQPQQSSSNNSGSGNGQKDTQNTGNSPSSQDPDTSGDPQSNGANQSTGGRSGDDDKDAAKKLQNLKSILDGSDKSGIDDLGKMVEQRLGQIHLDHKSTSVDFPPAENATLVAGNSDAILQRVEESARALKRRVTNLFEGRDRDKILTRHSGNRLDSKRLYRLDSGNFRVFQKRIDGIEMNTAVVVLLDCSTSMSQESRLQTAADAALALQGALNGVKGLSTSVAAFPAKVNDDPNGVHVVAEFGETTRQSAPKYAALIPRGFTPMAEAMLWAGTVLVSRKEERKILLVVSDGQPERETELSTVSCAKAAMIHGELAKAGIETLGLGIKIDVSWLFSRSRSINNLQDLPGAMFEMMQNVLLRDAA